MASRREVAWVAQRMYRAGWPTPIEIATEPAFADRARDNWVAIIEALASRYLSSSELRVDHLVTLGAECKENLARALELAGWDADDAPLFIIVDPEPEPPKPSPAWSHGGQCQLCGYHYGSHRPGCTNEP